MYIAMIYQYVGYAGLLHIIVSNNGKHFEIS